jgi:hypothetical protein
VHHPRPKERLIFPHDHANWGPVHRRSLLSAERVDIDSGARGCR